MTLSNFTATAVSRLQRRMDRRRSAHPLPSGVFRPPVPPGSVAPGQVQLAMDERLSEAGIYQLCADFAGISELYSPFMGYHELAAWEENWLLRAMVEPIARAVCKKWLVLKSRAGSTDAYDNRETVQALYDQFKIFDVHNLFRWAANRTCYAGGCKLFIDTGERGSDLEAPLVMDGVKLKGNLRGFIRIEPPACYPGMYNTRDPLAEDYFNPPHWYLGGKLVHTSRFIHFTANRLPFYLLPKYNFYGLPMAQIARTVIQDFMEANREVSGILKRLNLDVFQTDLGTLLKGSCGDSEELEALHNRVELFEAYRDNSTALVMDKESESFSSVSLPVSGLDVIVAQKLELLALVPRLPVMKMFGTPPKGFNATGEADENTFADRIAEEQAEILTPAAARVIDLLMLHVFGEVDEDIDFEWPPVKEKSEMEQAQISQIRAGTDQTYLQCGVVGAQEVRAELKQDKSSGYTFIEDEDDKDIS